MREAEELCDRIALIRNGRIIACGKFHELKKKFFPHEVLEIRCANPEKIRAVLSGHKSIARFKKYEGGAKIYLTSDKYIAQIIDLIVRADAGITGVNTVEPDLEDLYTKIMGADKDG
jgi:ABC-type multidrug transport system ATPase subunit